MLATVLLALAASACWGTADFTSGYQARRVPLGSVLLVGQGVGLLIAAVIVVAGAFAPPSGGAAAASLGAGACGIAGLACFYRALASGTMSIVAPIGATGVAIPVLVGVIGGNHLSALQAAGMVATVAGVALAARQSDGLRRGSHREAVALALVAACAFGCFFVLAHQAARAAVPWWLLLSHLTSTLGAIALIAAVRAPLRAVRARDLSVLVVAGALDLGATGLYGLANRHGELSLVAVAGSLYPVATVLLARAVLGERVGRLQGVGVTLALAGVAAIAA